jgi:hypothetical protein
MHTAAPLLTAFVFTCPAEFFAALPREVMSHTVFATLSRLPGPPSILECIRLLASFGMTRFVRM